METDYPLEVGFKADLTLKMGIEMEFDRIPAFPRNKRTSGIEVVIFEVVSKTIERSAFPGMKLFCEMKGNGLSGIGIFE